MTPRSREDIEARIDANLKQISATSLAIAEDLAELHERQLFSGSWPAYVEDRFGIARAHAYRLVAWAKLRRSVSNGDKLGSEAAARPLTPLVDRPELVARIVAEAERRGSLSAGMIEAVRDELVTEELVDAPLPYAEPARHEEAVANARALFDSIEASRRRRCREWSLVVDKLGPKSSRWPEEIQRGLLSDLADSIEELDTHPHVIALFEALPTSILRRRVVDLARERIARADEDSSTRADVYAWAAVVVRAIESGRAS
jgi:hypothetical protein